MTILAAGLLVLLGACSNVRSTRAADGVPTTTTVSGLDASLPLASDLGGGYEEVSASQAMTGSCSLAMREPTRRAARSFVSNAAQEGVDLQLVPYGNEQTAAGAFADARAASACKPSQFGDAGGRPRHVEIDGADMSFDIGFADQADSIGVTVAVVGGTIVVAQSALHHGAGTAEPLGAHEAIARAIARLR